MLAETLWIRRRLMKMYQQKQSDVLGDVKETRNTSCQQVCVVENPPAHIDKTLLVEL